MWKRVAALFLFAACAFAADVSGRWQVNVETNQGSGAPLVELQQQGEKLTGTFHSQILGDAKLTGTVKGNASSSPSPATPAARPLRLLSRARSKTIPR